MRFDTPKHKVTKFKKAMRLIQAGVDCHTSVTVTEVTIHTVFRIEKAKQNDEAIDSQPASGGDGLKGNEAIP